MQVTPHLNLLSELHKKVFWQQDAARTPIEHVVEYLLTGVLARNAPSGTSDLAEQVLNCNLKDTRVVVLGGGTGLSTIVGGNSQMPDWPNRPLLGMKQEFPCLNSIVCTTDDGGSTGILLKSLPMIGIGDLRKILISSILPENLHRKYSLGEREIRNLIRAIHNLFNYRFSKDTLSFEQLADPLFVVPPDVRHSVPKLLAASFQELGAYISPGNSGPSIPPAGHSMGNLLLASAIFRAARGMMDRPPGLREIQRGIDTIAVLIGAPVGRIHAATATPGQLRFRYANGVDVCGQSKSAHAHRDSPVEHVIAEFISRPIVSLAVQHAIANADLIVYAPGSLYTSIIPLLQLEPIVAAIRSNRTALKVLGANSWIQEGETDISFKNRGRGFLVSELIEAYDRNTPLGIKGLVDIVLSANLEHIPGNILRNYALEGKSPIHLDRSQVEIIGVHPIEATLFSPERQRKTRVIHHDPRRFALAIRTLLYADKFLRGNKGYRIRSSMASKMPAAGTENRKTRGIQQTIRGSLLCTYLESIKRELEDKSFQPPAMRDFFVDLAWENRDIHSSHLRFFRGVRVVPAKEWKRSTEWDNILGFFDPQDRYLKLHEELLSHPEKLQEDLLVALGESLLGQYIEKRRWIRQHGARRYEILLKPDGQRECYLTDAQVHSYLKLARMIPDPIDNRIYRITINKDGGFLPPGLLFGLLYAWYLSGRGLTMEYEMSLFRWPLKSLIPLHAKDRIRKEALVKFFRTEVFGRPE
jgi:uncharacterized cofD-like protein